jgi:hypothetical protein
VESVDVSVNIVTPNEPRWLSARRAGPSLTAESSDGLRRLWRTLGFLPSHRYGRQPPMMARPDEILVPLDTVADPDHPPCTAGNRFASRTDARHFPARLLRSRLSACSPSSYGAPQISSKHPDDHTFGLQRLRNRGGDPPFPLVPNGGTRCLLCPTAAREGDVHAKVFQACAGPKPNASACPQNSSLRRV